MSPTTKLERVFAIIGGAVVVGALILSGLGIRVVQRGLSARDAPSAVEATIARTVRLASIPRSARELRSPIGYSLEAREEAKAHWADHCAGCHGNNGSGETAMGRNLFPKAPDMRSGETQDLTDGELYYVIKNGIRLTGMPAWGEPGDKDEESWALVGFIRYLPELSSEEAAAMKRLNPMSAHEFEELREEEEFLHGDKKGKNK